MDVAVWLTRLGLPQYIEPFQAGDRAEGSQASHEPRIAGLSRIRGVSPRGGSFGQASSRELGFGNRFITENCCLMLCLLHLFAKLENGGDGDEEGRTKAKRDRAEQMICRRMMRRSRPKTADNLGPGW